MPLAIVVQAGPQWVAAGQVQASVVQRAARGCRRGGV
jgi:hypothetical protein